MSQTAIIKAGAIQQLESYVAQENVESVFLVTGKQSFVDCGADAAVEPIRKARQVVRFCDFEPNPKIADVESGLALFRKLRNPLIIAIGGGSVMDMAKLIGFCATQEAAPVEVTRGARSPCNQPSQLIAVPTTAGSGSEATHFAVVYVDGKKVSVADSSILPSVALVDPELTYDLPANITAVTGLDAFSQAVESFWSVHSTEETRADSKLAIRLVVENLESAVCRPNLENKMMMSRSSYLAGKAINLTKTTAPHAISYTMTSRFGVPHGLAVALTLGEVLIYNNQVHKDDLSDPRGTTHVRSMIQNLCESLGCTDAWAAAEWIKDLIRSIGLPSSLREVGIRTPEDRRMIVENVNLQRLANNPRVLTTDSLQGILERVA